MVTPRSAQEAAEAVRFAVVDGQSVAVCGSGSRRSWQPPLTDPDRTLILDTTGLSGPGRLHAENLSATFPAGLSLAAVKAQCADVELWLPLEHADAPDATFGGCLAAGFTNPLRWSRGLPRDWILGLELVDSSGRLLSLGGELVKNVAGYDLVRVQLGAWGRLGLITAATVRLLPLPEAEATVTGSFAAPAEASGALRAAGRHPSRPATLEITGGPHGLRLMARLVGDAATVEERAGSLRAVFGGEVALGAGSEESWREYGRERARLEAAYAWRLKLSVAAPGLEEAFSLAGEVCAGRSWALAGQAGDGVYTLYWSDGEGPLPVLGAALDTLRSRGFVTAEGAAAAQVFGTRGWSGFPPHRMQAQGGVEAALIAAMAPGRVFNPHLLEAPAASPGLGSGAAR
jgi:glycolate oxidase FAD binding subunit